jgi:REP element-mobilizing transposase RayT
MPYWLLTSTTYGTWLPGDARGSVTSVRDVRPGDTPSPSRREHSRFGEAFEPENVGLRRSAEQRLQGEPVRLNASQAVAVVEQFRETAEHRGWRLVAAAVMTNHFQLVVGTRDAVDGRKMLTDFKAYATRRLNREHASNSGRRWWTSGRSARRLIDEAALTSAVNYVLHKQPNPLAAWPNERRDHAAGSVPEA